MRSQVLEFRLATSVIRVFVLGKGSSLVQEYWTAREWCQE